jgi:hypothetical protein
LRAARRKKMNQGNKVDAHNMEKRTSCMGGCRKPGLKRESRMRNIPASGTTSMPLAAHRRESLIRLILEDQDTSLHHFRPSCGESSITAFGSSYQSFQDGSEELVLGVRGLHNNKNSCGDSRVMTLGSSYQIFQDRSDDFVLDVRGVCYSKNS